MQSIAEELGGAAEASLLREWSKIEIPRLNAQTRGDVFADEVEPAELFGRKRDPGLGLIHEPFVESLSN